MEDPLFPSQPVTVSSSSDRSASSRAPSVTPAGVVVLAAVVGGLVGFGAGIASQLPSVQSWIEDRSDISLAENSNATTTRQTQSVVEEESEVIDAVKEVSPSVVSVIISKEVQNYFNQTDPFSSPFDFFFNQPSQPSEPQTQQVGGGTGFIISEDGLILTNRHVVSDETAQYSVILEGGKTFEAKVLSRDPFNDLAVIKIEEKNLPVVELGESLTLKLGQTVVAIGNTLALYQNTVTKGVVSGIGRNISAGDPSGSESLNELIQTDAAINPGNSGGPLINLAGQVIGVNVAVDRGGESIGFAIPIDAAKSAIESVKKTGRIVRPLLGIRYIPITPEFSKKNNLKVDYGVLVAAGDRSTDLAVVPGSAADKAGIVENDIILELNGKRIDAEHPLSDQIQKMKPEDAVTLKILRGGEEKTVEATLQEAGNN